MYRLEVSRMSCNQEGALCEPTIDLILEEDQGDCLVASIRLSEVFDAWEEWKYSMEF